MVRKLGIIAAVVLTSAASCRSTPLIRGVEPASSSEVQSEPVPFIPSGSAGFPNCVGVGNPTTTIRIKIPRGFDTIGNGRMVKVKSGSGATDAEDEEKAFQDSYDLPGGSDEFDRNPFHLDIGQIKNASDPDQGAIDPAIIKVKIILADTRYKFHEVRAYGELIRGISYPKEETMAANWLCQKRSGYIVRTGKPGREQKSVLTFFIKRQNIMRPMPINLLIVADLPNSNEGDATPIIIDPKIKNEG